MSPFMTVVNEQYVANTGISQAKAANYARLLYLGVVFFGILAHVIRLNLIEDDDAAATVDNIKDSELLFRLSFVSDLLMLLCLLMLGQAFYALFKSVDKNYAYLMMLFVTISVPLHMVIMLNQFAVVLLLSDSSYLGAFDDTEINALVMLFLELYTNGYLISQIFFGLWLLPLGYLSIKSGYFPKFIGILVIIGGVCMMMDTFMVFLFPEFYENISDIILGLTSIGELSYILWLWIKGVKLPESNKTDS